MLAVAAVAASPAGAVEGPRILALGDSLTAGYGLPPEQGFAAKLQAMLSRTGPVTVIDAGISGDTSAAGLSLLDWEMPEKPDAALVELGANDMLRGVDPRSTRDNLAKILERLGAAHIPVLLCGMQASLNWGSDYKSRYDAIFASLAEQYHVALYPFFLDGVALDPKLLQPDGLHPNAAGVDVIVERILPSVAKLIGRPPP
jgi:acyl-CoA thioesterase-1